MKENRPRRPREAGRCVPQALLWRKVGRASGGPQTGVKLASKSAKPRAGCPLLIRFPISWKRHQSRGAVTGIAGPAGHNMFDMFDASTPKGALFPTAGPTTAMTDEKSANRQQQTMRGDEARQDRLKAKLRENLKRRKSQGKERSRSTLSSDGHQASPDEEVGKTDV